MQPTKLAKMFYKDLMTDSFHTNRLDRTKYISTPVGYR